MKGIYTSFNDPIWSFTIALKLWNDDSKAIDQLLGINFISLSPYVCKPTIINKTNIVYKPKLVKLKFKKPKIGAFILIKFIISNWSKGELINIEEIIELCKLKMKYQKLNID